ncbi:MAG: hypothetical protein QME28_00230 [Candidatus Saccharicenans sp.]|nr:hypothetical protein [Candidatus Saccharicenans sp.]
MIAKIVMIIYYLISAFFVAIVLKNFIQEKESRDRALLYLIVLIPFILRLFRVK